MIIDDTIEARGFEPAATAIVLRTMGSCYVMQFRPDTRPLIGIGLFTAHPQGDGHAFTFDAQALRAGEMPDDLLAWLEPRMPEEGALVSYENRGSVPKRLAAIASAEHYPRIAAATAETSTRWRDLPRAYTWHRRQAVAPAMPCLCGSDGIADCQAELPGCFLPHPEVTERQLIQEAVDGWLTWANLFGDFDDHAHPARRAVRDLRARQQAARNPREG